jgi:hypothetical protein
MLRLRDFPWWPNACIDERGRLLNPTDAVLKNVRRLGNELLLILECEGTTYTAKAGAHLPENDLILLCHILLQHYGLPLSEVENFDVDFDAWRER